MIENCLKLFMLPITTRNLQNVENTL